MECLVGGGFDGAVVVGAQQLSVTQAGRSAVAVWGDVVDVAAGGGFITTSRISMIRRRAPVKRRRHDASKRRFGGS
jgi:hypothetical protein